MFLKCIKYKFILLIIHGILFIFAIIFMVISIISIKKIYSPFDCRNDYNYANQNYQKFRKNATISFIIEIISFILYCFMLLFELYFAMTRKTEDIKYYEKDNLIEEEKIQTTLKNTPNESELKTNLNNRNK